MEIIYIGYLLGVYADSQIREKEITNICFIAECRGIPLNQGPYQETPWGIESLGLQSSGLTRLELGGYIKKTGAHEYRLNRKKISETREKCAGKQYTDKYGKTISVDEVFARIDSVAGMIKENDIEELKLSMLKKEGDENGKGKNHRH